MGVNEWPIRSCPDLWIFTKYRVNYLLHLSIADKYLMSIILSFGEVKVEAGIPYLLFDGALLFIYQMCRERLGTKFSVFRA